MSQHSVLLNCDVILFQQRSHYSST